jgi:hypothetical protein
MSAVRAPSQAGLGTYPQGSPLGSAPNPHGDGDPGGDRREGRRIQAQAPAATVWSASSAPTSVRSQVKSGSLRPKWP